jgi:hypothetical protein
MGPRRTLRLFMTFTTALLLVKIVLNSALWLGRWVNFSEQCKKTGKSEQ